MTNTYTSDNKLGVAFDRKTAAAEHKVGLQYVAPGETQKFAVSVAVK